MEIKNIYEETIFIGDSLQGAYLRGAYLRGANLQGADLRGANLRGANLQGADLQRANLQGADLQRADLRGANLQGANLQGVDLQGADLQGANLQGANLQGANLQNTKGLIKLIGVYPGNYYWKRFHSGLQNNGYKFKVGLNKLDFGETFASDERVLCSYPGFHFASRSWCALYYGDRPLEALIRIPLDAQINEPWATDGKASADMIEIIQVFEVKTGKDVTHLYK